MMTNIVLPFANIWIWKELLNEIINKSSTYRTILLYVVFFLLIKTILYVIAKIDEYISTRYSDELQFYIESIMIDKTSRIELSYFDYASMGDRIKRTRAYFGEIKNTAWVCFGIISEIVSIVISVVLVCQYNWRVAIITVGVLIPYTIYNKKHVKRMHEIEKSQVRDSRKMDYFRGSILDIDNQFEFKLNGIGDYFVKKYKEIWDDLFVLNRRIDIKHRIVSVCLLALNISSEILVIILSAVEVVSKRIGIGDLQYNISIVARLREQLTGLFNDINGFIVNNSKLIELREFVNMESEYEKCGNIEPNENPKIEFKDVCFKYPNTTNYVLNKCSFVVMPNEKLSLVGLNGSGKSTIIKLLFRFYDPEEGNIYIDNRDIKEYNIYSLRKVFGVLFQDYVTYCLPLREIISLSDFGERNNDIKLSNACTLSGANSFIKNFEDGFNTIIGRYYADNGKDLSGGQWQLIGLSRTYFRNAKIIILDEPSAALDPIAEDRIFNQLYSLSENKTAITISHRLSNTTGSDRIIVIEGGRIIEQGTFKQLIERNGKYAYLFNLQARKYL